MDRAAYTIFCCVVIVLQALKNRWQYEATYHCSLSQEPRGLWLVFQTPVVDLLVEQRRGERGAVSRSASPKGTGSSLGA